MKSFWQKILRWYFGIFTILVIILGLLSAIYTGVYVDRSLKKALLQRTLTVAEALDLRKVLMLRGTPDDEANPAYTEIKQKLRNIVSANPDARFVYLLGMRDRHPFFYADSELPSSPDISPPGQVYYEASETMHRIFDDRRAAIEDIYTDRWGTWLTAVAPMIDPETGRLVAVVGMDIAAREYLVTLLMYIAVPVLIATLLAVMALGGLYMRRRGIRELNFKSELVSIAMHDIRSPLGSMRWMLDRILEKDVGVTGDGGKDLRLVRESCERLFVTVNELLDFSALESAGVKQLVREPVEMVGVFHWIIKNLELSFKEKFINIQVDGSIAAPLVVYGDYNKLKRIFGNLLSNAIKYSPAGSTITIGRRFDSGTHVFWIKDHGIGIPKKDQAKIFQEFFRAANAKALAEVGTGLGLYYVRQAVALQGGKTWFESEENNGTTFFVELPFGGSTSKFTEAQIAAAVAHG